MPTIYLTGRHGSGKSTLGHALAPRLDARFWSVGAALRVCRAGHLSRDIPHSLTLAVYQNRWTTESLPTTYLTTLLAYWRTYCQGETMVIDGALRRADDVNAILARGDQVVHLRLPAELARARIEARALESRRRAMLGPAARDMALPRLLRALRGSGAHLRILQASMPKDALVEAAESALGKLR